VFGRRSFYGSDTSGNDFVLDSELYAAPGDIQPAPGSATSRSLMHLTDASGHGYVST
jgi:hypothetical protein